MQRRHRKPTGKPQRQHVIERSAVLVEDGPMRSVYLVCDECVNCGKVLNTYERVYDYTLAMEAALLDGVEVLTFE